ncbi:MAG: glycosyltransferase [Candidatus Synoicihabitans palmerolidicus]|nr:glycosyltransferase [Candidatus Synoicihabitans palmerolidicus]
MSCSVLVNTRNHARYIDACLESVLADVDPSDEIIGDNNGSTDSTFTQLSRHIPRIQTVQHPHHASQWPMQNQAEVIHLTLQKATGDIIILIDQDDMFLPGKREQIVQAFATNPALILVQSPLRWIDADGNPLPRLRRSNAVTLRIPSPRPIANMTSTTFTRPVHWHSDAVFSSKYYLSIFRTKSTSPPTPVSASRLCSKAPLSPSIRNWVVGANFPIPTLLPHPMTASTC